jgi:hypothetical protein
MKNPIFTYNGPEALEMIKTCFPDTWEQEITNGQIFIKGLMKMYNLSALDAFEKFLNTNKEPYNGISTFASLYIMESQGKISDEIKAIRAEQLNYGNQLVALEKSEIISFKEKRELREFYISKQIKLQQRVEKLALEYPVIGAQSFIVQTNLFEN